MTRTRRSLLRTVSGAAVAAVGASSSTTGGAAQSDRTSDASDPVRYSRIDTRNADCASGTDDYSTEVSRWRRLVRFSGRIRASDPCHDAVIETTDVDGDTLVVTVGTRPEGQNGGCVQCVGAVEYRGLLALSRSADVESIEVRHADGGSDSEPAVTAEIVESTAGCASSRADPGGDRQLDVDGETVEFRGAIETPVPCYVAAVDNVEVQDATAVVEVVAEWNGTEVCPGCAGIVRYQGVVEIDNPGKISTVEIVHAGVEDSFN